MLALGDVRRAPHELHQIPGCVQNRMADGVDVFDGAARKKDSEFQFVFQLFIDCSIDCPLPLGSILRMSAQQTFSKSRRPIFWIEAINAVPFLGQMHGVSSRYPPGPTPCVREPLRFRQVRLASLQLLFLQFQGLGSKSPIHPGRQQSQPEEVRVSKNARAIAARPGLKEAWSKCASRWTRIDTRRERRVSGQLTAKPRSERRNIPMNRDRLAQALLEQLCGRDLRDENEQIVAIDHTLPTGIQVCNAPKA
jgi:hypothetical protein